LNQIIQIYNGLFQFIIFKLNNKLISKKKIEKKLFLMDYPGVHKYSENDLNDLIINYVNDKIINKYNISFYENEQKFYLDEQINWKYIKTEEIDMTKRVDKIENIKNRVYEGLKIN
jgi:myosin heavy subunit